MVHLSHWMNHDLLKSNKFSCASVVLQFEVTVFETFFPTMCNVVLTWGQITWKNAQWDCFDSCFHDKQIGYCALVPSGVLSIKISKVQIALLADCVVGWLCQWLFTESCPLGPLNGPVRERIWRIAPQDGQVALVFLDCLVSDTKRVKIWKNKWHIIGLKLDLGHDAN